MSDVFISYSRKERVFADKLASELEKDGRTVWIDRARIELTSEWWEEIKRGIEASDNFVLIMSPDSMASPVCHLEIEYARQLTKRIIPVYHIAHDYEGTKTHFGDRLYKNDRDGFLLKLYGDRNPMLLFEENWKIIPGINRIEALIKVIDRDEQDIPTKMDEADLQTFFPSLRKAIDTDIEHVHQHTYLFNRTRDWLKKGQKTSDLLNGVETLEAEEWLKNWETDKADREAHGLAAKVPQPNVDIRAYIIASREAEEQRKRVLRNLRVGTLTFAVVGVIATVLAISSFISLQDTQVRADTAATQAAVAVTAVADANEQLTAVPPTLTQVNQQVITAQDQANLAATQAVDAELREAQAVIAVADANEQLTAVPPTLTQVAQLVQDGENRIESLRLASEAVNILNNPERNVEIAALLGIRAVQTGYTAQADAALVRAVDNLYTRQTFIGHTNFVNSVAFSPDGRYALSGAGGVVGGIGDDTTLRLWEVESGEQVRVFTGHTDDVYSVAFSPDGRYALSGSGDRTLRLWEVESGEQVRIFIGHTEDVNSVAFSPDGRYALSGSGDRTLRLWEVESGEQVRIFIGHTEDVNSVAFSPDGHYALSGSYDTTLRLWEVESGEQVRIFTGHPESVWSVAFSPDGRYALSGAGGIGGDDNTLRLWEVESGEQMRVFTGHGSRVMSVAFSPDGRYALSGSGDRTLRLWEVESGEQVRVFTGHGSGVNSVVFSPDGRYALSGAGGVVGGRGDDNTLRLWSGVQTLTSEVESGEQVRIFTGHTESVMSVAFSPDGRYALSGPSDQFADDNTMRLWEVESGKQVRIFTGHRSPVMSVAFSPDGRYALSGLIDNTMRLWEVETGAEVRVFSGHTESVWSVAFSPDSRYALSGSTDNTMRLWEVESGEQVRVFSGHTESVWSVAFSPDGRYALSGSVDRTMRLWEVESGAEVRVFSGHTSSVVSVAFSPDGRYALSGSWDTTLRLWEVESGAEVRVFSGHTSSVESVAFSPDGRYALSGSWDTTLRLWEVGYRDFISYACTRVFRDFTEVERLQFGITDNEPTCPQFASN